MEQLERERRRCIERKRVCVCVCVCVCVLGYIIRQIKVAVILTREQLTSYQYKETSHVAANAVVVQLHQFEQHHPEDRKSTLLETLRLLSYNFLCFTDRNTCVIWLDNSCNKNL